MSGCRNGINGEGSWGDSQGKEGRKLNQCHRRSVVVGSLQGNKTPFAGDECSKSEATHSRKQPFTCTGCHKSFNLKHVLQRHKRTHTGERPFSCNECDKSFNRRDILLKHKRTHASKKPLLNGNHSGKRFRLAERLLERERTHSQEKPFTCSE